MANANGVCVSHQWIYALIWDDKQHGGELWKRLRLPRQRRYQRQLAKHAGLGKIPHRVGIEQRPDDVNERRHIGHWEGDTVLKGHKESGLVTLVERRSGYLLAARLSTITATVTAKAMTRLLKAQCRPSPWITGRNSPSTDRLLRPSRPRPIFVTRTAHASVVPMKIPMA